MDRVAVAISGGVDSSVAALELKEQGYDLIGLSLKLGQGADLAGEKGAQICRQLGIVHHVVEVSTQFERLVIGPVVSEYAAGRTPNPCAVCNARVKLPLLWRAARELGCQSLATGHYARLGAGPEGGVVLSEGVDQAKSQAYFLARVKPELLNRLILPLGSMYKSQVWERARSAGLASADQAESQDVCFLPAGGWDELVAGRGALRPGVVEDMDGQRLTTHQGIHRFTVGQRRGLGVALGHAAYVIALDGQRAAVRIGTESMLWATGLEAAEPLWAWPQAMAGPLTVRVRYAHQGVQCRVRPKGSKLAVELAEPVRAVAPGQLAVFQIGDKVAGSAWIERAWGHGRR